MFALSWVAKKKFLLNCLFCYPLLIHVWPLLYFCLFAFPSVSPCLVEVVVKEGAEAEAMAVGVQHRSSQYQYLVSREKAGN